MNLLYMCIDLYHLVQCATPQYMNKTHSRQVADAKKLEIQRQQKQILGSLASGFNSETECNECIELAPPL